MPGIDAESTMPTTPTPKPKTTRTSSTTTRRPVIRAVADASEEATHEPLAIGAEEVLHAGLNPASALDLLARLITAAASASKDGMERIKTVDKLINTARAMLETRLKTEEAAAIASRLDELETKIEALGRDRGLVSDIQEEVWRDDPAE
jgi:hypothetical protein